MFIALLTGKVSITADARVKNINQDEDSTEIVMKKMKTLIELAASNGGLENIRKNEEQKEVFLTFVNTCLVHFCSSMTLRYAAYNTVISDIFTESDEAFAMLLLENNAKDYNQMVIQKRKFKRSEANPKYTKDPNDKEKFKGWSKDGIKRYNYLVKVVKRNRKLTHSKEMEVELKDKYAKLCGKDGKRNNEGDLCEGYESDDESLEAYDGFAGDDEEIRVERTAAV